MQVHTFAPTILVLKSLCGITECYLHESGEEVVGNSSSSKFAC